MADAANMFAINFDSKFPQFGFSDIVSNPAVTLMLADSWGSGVGAPIFVCKGKKQVFGEGDCTMQNAFNNLSWEEMVKFRYVLSAKAVVATTKELKWYGLDPENFDTAPLPSVARNQPKLVASRKGGNLTLKLFPNDDFEMDYSYYNIYVDDDEFSVTDFVKQSDNSYQISIPYKETYVPYETVFRYESKIISNVHWDSPPSCYFSISYELRSFTLQFHNCPDLPDTETI